MVNNRINSLSKNKEVFVKSKPIYNKTLRDSAFRNSLNFELKTKLEPRNRHRKREFIYYIQPFDISAKQNLGKLFFDLINKHFPEELPFAKNFNNKKTNNNKLSYY